MDTRVAAFEVKHWQLGSPDKHDIQLDSWLTPGSASAFIGQLRGGKGNARK